MISGTEQRRRTDLKNKRDILFFPDLSPDEIKHIETVIIKKRFRKDQVVLSEQDTSNYMYLVYSGKVRVVKLSVDRREQIVTMYNKGDFFGEMSFLDGEPAPATVIAHEDSVIGLLHKDDFEHYLLNHDGIRQKVIKLLCRRLRDACKLIKTLSFDNAEHRILIALGHMEELYGVRDSRGVIINAKLPHRLLANYASVSRETATRVLNRLEQSGVIAVLENKSFLLREAFHKRLKEIVNPPVEPGDSYD